MSVGAKIWSPPTEGISEIQEGIMKSKYLPLMATVLLGFGCAPPAEEPPAETPAVDLEAERDALMAADKAWSEVSDAEEFLSYFTDGAHFMPFGAPLAQGDAIRTALVSIGSLEWEATGADVAESGELGYTIGTFELTTEQDGASMVTVGKYVTVWSKQADGSWKVQVDCFNADGPPTAAEES